MRKFGAGGIQLCQVDAALREEVQNSPLFHSVSEALHNPVPGYTITDSYKTLDHYGNLQLTFSAAAQPVPTISPTSI